MLIRLRNASLLDRTFEVSWKALRSHCIYQHRVWALQPGISDPPTYVETAVPDISHLRPLEDPLQSMDG